ncbi:MAG: hypothetical protein HKN89_02295 [Eudoraea sp.]|nr:hypothetical protein [Eudoraea sp.]
MKNSVVFINLMVLMLVSPFIISAQDVKIGDVYTIGASDNTTYDHIIFPRKHTIIKRGGIANFKRVAGMAVVVKGITYDADGMTIVTLERVDGIRFFSAFRKIEAKLESAVNEGELISR